MPDASPDASPNASIVDRFYETLCRGDLDAAIACLKPDARIWHSSDCKAWTVADCRPGWEKMIAATTERGLADVRRSLTADGCVQEHVFYTRTASGEGMGLPCGLVVRIEDGLIAHINEYLDMTSAFPLPAEGPIRAPNRP